MENAPAVYGNITAVALNGGYLMADLISREALLRKMLDPIYTWEDYDEMENLVSYLPAVDAVEVVRCRECNNACDCGDPYLVCTAWGCPCDADEWCSRGKRREENAAD